MPMPNPNKERLLVRAEQMLYPLNKDRVEQIWELTREGVLTTYKDPLDSRMKMYDPFESCRRYIAYLEDKLGGSKTSVEELNKAKLAESELKQRKLIAEAERVEGVTVYKSDVYRIWVDVYSAFKQRLLSTPETESDKFINLKSRDEARDVLDFIMRSLLDLLIADCRSLLAIVSQKEKNLFCFCVLIPVLAG